MMKHTLAILAIAMIPTCLYAVDGQVLINQATVIAAGGFPYKITQPGSYKLSGNLVVTALDVDGIDINADNVTLDLNGFTMTGPIVCSSPVLSHPVCTSVITGYGIFSKTNSNITVKNGAIRGFLDGLHLSGSAALVTDLISSANAGEGFLLNGVGGVIARCAANGNGDSGVIAESASVSDSAANYNGFDGFGISRSALFHSQASSNYRFGIFSDVSIYGSNVAISNASGDVIGDPSQGNNRCTSGLC